MKKKSEPSSRRGVAPTDRYAEREARKYAHPIPSREAILDWLEGAGRPLPLEALAQGLRLHAADEIEALNRRLAAMLRDGQVVKNRRDEYCLVKRLPLVAGTVVGHRDGFGFLIPDEGGEDIFLPPRQMRELMHGDRVLVRIQGRDARGRPEGSLVDVLERNTRELAGRYFEESGVGFVAPDNRRITHEVLIPPDGRSGARSGQMVVVEITQPPTKRSQPLGRILRVLGEHRAPGMEVDLAVHAYGLPHRWPAEVEGEIAALRPQVSEADKAGRLDLRATPLVTIDGEDARDFDDAVYCEPSAGGFRLLVAIADVSHYVKPGTALDLEARNRGNSVYFPDRVIPMLPEVLSNGLCSLNPQVDRLCLVCEMRVSGQGEVTRSKFHAAVMRSAARLTYTAVAGILVDRDSTLRHQYARLLPHLENLYAVYRALARARARRGAIDFDTVETRVVFGADQRVLAIRPLVRNAAHKLIEECMIAANVEAARLLSRHRLPTLYRVHAGPEADRLEELHAFLNGLGLRLGGGLKPEPRHYARLLERVRTRPDRDLIETVLLRSLAQAVYSPVNIGHFGLALTQYAHFTSPIRRYPDLLVHRGIHHLLAGGSERDFPYSATHMDALGSHCSMTERRADEATREAVDSLKAQYMQDKVGQEFDGRITGVTPFGLFVRLDELYVEGLVHVTSLPSDYYDYDAVGQRLVGERSRRVFRLTEAVRVRVVNVNLDERKIDFELAEAAAAGNTARGGASQRRRKRTHG